MNKTPLHCQFGGNLYYCILSFFAVFTFSQVSLAQCAGFPATVGPSDCSPFPTLTNNTSIESGQTYGLCSFDNTVFNVSNINLNGGTLRVCADAVITGNLNSGTIVVECGATLSFPNGALLNNNVGIVNYGTVQVTGNLNFQNAGNFFYNESDSSRLLVSGNILTGQNTNQTGYLKNNGFISIGGTLSAFPGAFFCLGPGSEILCNNFVYMQNCGGPNDRFQRVSNTGVAIIRYASSASLRGTVTNNATIEIWRQSGASLNFNGCGSWGSATLLNSAPAIATRPKPNLASCPIPNCQTIIVLPVEMKDFNAEKEDESAFLSWRTISERDNDRFEIMRSTDGKSWQSIGSVSGKGNSTQVQEYTFIDKNPFSGISYYRLDQYDLNGEITSSSIKSIEFEKTSRAEIELFPNPADNQITIRSAEQIRAITIQSITGANVELVEISNLEQKEISLAIGHLPGGVYFVRVNGESLMFTKTGF